MADFLCGALDRESEGSVEVEFPSPRLDPALCFMRDSPRRRDGRVVDEDEISAGGTSELLDSRCSETNIEGTAAARRMPERSVWALPRREVTVALWVSRLTGRCEVVAYDISVYSFRLNSRSTLVIPQYKV